ncbi:MAG TPA: SPOR domain-containing protein [Methyloceanibacter sp.]|nr:SPOR domain-containing protein [Methyloceanibacter sp.]
MFAFFWIVLGGLSGVYLFTLLTNPGALGGQPGETPIGSDQASRGLGAGEVGEIKSTLRELSQRMAEIDTRLKPLEKAAGSAGSLSDNSSPASSGPEPATPPDATEAKKPDIATAQAAEKPAEAAKPVEAPKPAEAPKPTQIAAVEPVPAPKPAEMKQETPSASSAPTPEEPAEAEGENDSEPTPPPVTVSEVPDEPLTEVTPGPSLSGNLSSPKSSTTDSVSSPSSTSGSESATPAPNTEIAALSPTMLPPAANDGTTRYGIEIGVVAKQDGLRPLWREFLTNHAALVAGLQPRRVLAPDKKWRLIAGPFANAAEANQACLLFKKAQKPCEATVFAGDSL